MKFHGVVAAAVAAIALAACGGSPTDSITFVAPPGFVSKASIGPFMEVWGDSNHQSLMLFAIPGTNGDLSDSFGKTGTSNLALKSRQAITICNNQPAEFAVGTGKANNADANDIFELLATRVGGKTYIAMYGRAPKALPDPAAEKAIKNICPKGA